MIEARPSGGSAIVSISATGSSQYELNADTIWRGESVIDNVPGIASCRRLEKDHQRFLVRAGPMLNAARDDAELARVESYDMIPEFHSHFATPNQKHLVLVLVMMPRELTLELDQLDFLSV